MCFMNFAINGYTKEYISILRDGLGVEYIGMKQTEQKALPNHVKTFLNNRKKQHSIEQCSGT